jgi:CheY-like chemotaxis protein
MSNKTVLVIEDNALNMKLVRSLLSIGKHGMIEAVDAESGIQLARKQRPDLILMDIQLPNMDGFDATRIIKSDPILKDVAIIALTSYAMDGDERRAREAGCDGYISKPIDTRAFLNTVEEHLAIV